MHKRITQARKKLDKAREAFNEAVREIQKTCDHPELGEADYKPLSGGGAFPPLRICLHCAMTEDGWGPGFVVLRDAGASGKGARGKASAESPMRRVRPVRRISREEIYDLRQGLMVVDAHKGPLLRKEATVAEFVDGLTVEQLQERLAASKGNRPRQSQAVHCYD